MGHLEPIEPTLPTYDYKEYTDPHRVILLLCCVVFWLSFGFGFAMATLVWK
jgi:hypothetical protein